MSWAEDVLRRYRHDTGRYVDHIVLGSATKTAATFELVHQHNFSELEACLREVTLNPDLDLGNVKIYGEALVTRGFLIREHVTVGNVEGAAIGVYPADDDDAIVDRDTLLKRARLGLLRPVQRYSLMEGMKRAAALANDILPKMQQAHGDPWGYACIRKGQFGNEVAMTPPIIEEIPSELQETPILEFLVCDGNHRILHNVWMADDPQPVPAIVIRGHILEPYYAIPFGWKEWQVTCDNCVATTPDEASKYQARKVPPSSVRADLRRRRDLFRRYYRDFNTGFGDIGGQGGAY